jgi:hypothetical protein
VETSEFCILESDASAIRAFVREMVSQAMIPFMERCISTWNDQVASRRRGLGGRFMSLSKKWTGFGSSSRTGSPFGSSSGSGTNYDTASGTYGPASSEAIMRKLADFAFMLRDYRLAYSTYELLRTDFSNDKAWKYWAGANEMAAISYLVSPVALSLKMRAEVMDQMLDSALFSYVTRCSSPYEAVRSHVLAIELLKARGGALADDIVRVAFRLFESGCCGDIGHAFLTERIAAAFANYTGRIAAVSSRRRKSAVWYLLAAESWLALDMPYKAQSCLREAASRYGLPGSGPSFLKMRAHILELQERLEPGTDSIVAPQARILAGEMSGIEEQSEKLDLHKHRKSVSMVGGFGALSNDPIDTGPLGKDEVRVEQKEFQ